MFFDFIFLIAIGFAIFRGAKDGLFISVVSFLSLFIGMIGALKFSNIIKNFLMNSLGWESASIPLLAFVVAFFLAILAARFVAKIVTKFFETVFLGFFNRVFGAVFQILIVVLVGSVFLSIFDEINNIFTFVEHETLMNSVSYKIYLTLSESVLPSLYDLVKSLFSKSIDLLKEANEQEPVQA
ncbi:CvpA family protein [Myroides marinus]|uniref:CvpA family protein n=1 Tax=Myroides TaxID=76831 RepID=UPI0025750568|nr:CvpA family protein [Myroides marinus]MDM1360630.1 CvpA family protein [Myroides marinus]MDM1367417.1 CvpA family protein [Myroides marinus]MDM1370991.1 CvpA family protein [Myroides marinus]MDM1373916.1 CvpA family protein [Myroides marinus]MDM1379721.1 CvpA family protein [Myroides marinus]